jgi:hypothetical protein
MFMIGLLVYWGLSWFLASAFLFLSEPIPSPQFGAGLIMLAVGLFFVFILFSSHVFITKLIVKKWT